MTTEEIKAMIEHYDMFRSGENVGIRKNIPEAKKNIDAIRAAKPELIAYFKEEENRRAEEARRREETFEAIPGVKELRAIREQITANAIEMQRMLETGDERCHLIPIKTTEAEIKAKYPYAAWALMVERKATHIIDYQLSIIAERAYNALKDGKDPAEVKAAYDQEMHEWSVRHFWD